MLFGLIFGCAWQSFGLKFVILHKSAYLCKLKKRI